MKKNESATRLSRQVASGLSRGAGISCVLAGAAIAVLLALFQNYIYDDLKSILFIPAGVGLVLMGILLLWPPAKGVSRWPIMVAVAFSIYTLGAAALAASIVDRRTQRPPCSAVVAPGDECTGFHERLLERAQPARQRARQDGLTFAGTLGVVGVVNGAVCSFALRRKTRRETNS